MDNRDQFTAPSREIQRAEEFPVGFPIEFQQPQEEEIHLRDYFHILLRRKWTAIAFFLIVVTTVTIATFLKTPVYRSTVTVKIDKENPNVLKFKDIYEVERLDDDYYQTQYKVLKSRNLAKRVVRSLKLDQNAEWADSGGLAKRAVAKQPEEVAAKPVEEEVNSALIDRFLDRVTVEPLQKSRLVKVSFDSTSPALSAQVTNTIAKTFIDFNIESKFDATQQAREWLEKQLTDMKAKVERAEEQLNKYAADKGIVFVGSRSSTSTKDSEGENIITKKLSELSTQLTQATSDRIAKEALYRETLQGEPEASPLVLSNPLIQTLKKDAASMEAEYSQLSKVYKPDYPKMQRLKEQMNQIKARLDSETRTIVSGIKKDYEAAVKRESYLKTTLDKYKSEALDFNEKMVQYQILQREAETNRELYNGLLQRLKETGVSASLTASNIQVLDRAEIPRSPFKPRTSLNILIAVITGLFGGIGLAFFVEYLDNTIKTPDDIEREVALPSLGIVPSFGGEAGMSRMITFEDKKSPLSEAYRSIGTYIQFSSAARPPKTLLVTSARQGEGKTTTALNTAISLAHSYGRGILIDTDMRKPQLHKLFGLDNAKGLSSFLAGHIEIDQGLIQKTDIPDLDVIPSGVIPPNPSELLSSYRMKDLIHGLFSLYSFVVMDSPPLLGLSDSLVLSTLTDGVILVVRAGDTPKDSVQQGKKLLRGVNAKILGVVLNGIRESDMKYGSYSYYYTYYYTDEGYGLDKGKKRSSRKTA